MWVGNCQPNCMKHCISAQARIGDEERVRSDVEGWRRAEFAAPLTNGTHVPETPIQHMRDHAKNVREFAVADLVFEVGHDDGVEAARRQLLTTGSDWPRRPDGAEPDGHHGRYSDQQKR